MVKEAHLESWWSSVEMEDELIALANDTCTFQTSLTLTLMIVELSEVQVLVEVKYCKAIVVKDNQII